jgi:hypothetical protein
MPFPGGFRTPAAVAITYGASPGDGHVPEPYRYVGPHDGPASGDPGFWNARSGPPAPSIRSAPRPDAAAFFRDGRARVRARATATL